jgi:hypothetical protein
MSGACPLYPQKRTSDGVRGISAKCHQKRTRRDACDYFRLVDRVDQLRIVIVTDPVDPPRGVQSLTNC